MRRRFSLAVSSIAVSGLVLFTVFAARAQTRTDIFVTPIPNAPFSALVNVERSFVQKDGTVSHFRTTREIGRDSRGRIFNESRMLLPAAETGTPQVARIHLYDPQTRVSTMINVQSRTYSTGTVDHPPEVAPPVSPSARSLPQNEFTREEDLGSRQIEGVPVRGVRETQTIPADQAGSGKTVTIIDEYWYSDDLRINLMIRHSDPRTGSVTMTATRISRTEPDPARFEVPEGFTRAGAVAASQSSSQHE